MNTEVKR